MDIRKLAAPLTLRCSPTPFTPVLTFRTVPQLRQILLRLEAEALKMEPLVGTLFEGEIYKISQLSRLFVVKAVEQRGRKT